MSSSPLLARVLQELHQQIGKGEPWQAELQDGRLVLASPEGVELARVVVPFRLGHVMQQLEDAASRLEMVALFGGVGVMHRPAQLVKEGMPPQPLTETELAILLQLAEHNGRCQREVLMRDALQLKLSESDTDTLESHLYRLRKKLLPFGVSLTSEAKMVFWQADSH